MTIHNQADHISVNDAAKECGVRVDEIYRLVRSGRLKAVKVNRKLQINYHSLQEHVANRGNNG